MNYHFPFSLSIVRAGINILVTLCTHACYSSEHKLDVEHEFLELINKSMNLFKNIRTHMPELEGGFLNYLLRVHKIEICYTQNKFIFVL